MARSELTHLGKPSAVPASPDEAVLDRCRTRTRHRLCGALRVSGIHLHVPGHGQPDFAIIMIDYAPRRWLVESKSLKLYLNSFPQPRAFHEQCTVAIGKRIVKLLGPKWLRIGGYFYPRGGIRSTCSGSTAGSRRACGCRTRAWRHTGRGVSSGL
jgi:7-cyano-7-deazaguanine reductase